ncbi:uncharacterized protein BX663DRAFT_495762 [Cokeromyces recurvatus]|uniref:uncharacterized protein n=1 Tax=Cokeromyces recurvatus TaxID=90255 RepID=UPI00221FAFBD|nr:uncharacterized protein BX663DRAFT_495762 [Cokeromyces recurvatus]KAI7907396.1 hypothetical protein BX663DRAFT_495762 [Cokeromyces recurvatus]
MIYQPEKECNSKLPSISNLLSSSPPILNLSPPSPLLPSTPPHSSKSFNSYLSSPRLPSISPILSPIHSPTHTFLNTSIQQLSISTSQTIPPIQGDDPPQRLRLPSTSSIYNHNQPISPKTLFNDTYNQKSSNPWNSSHHTPSFTTMIENSPQSSQMIVEDSTISDSEYLCATSQYNRPRSTSTVSEPVPCTKSSITTITLNDREDKYDDDDDDEEVEEKETVMSSKSVASTQLVFDSFGQPKQKRRRGRPPISKNISSNSNQDNEDNNNKSWTFLTPTVWDVFISEEQKERELKANQKEQQLMMSWSSSKKENKQVLLNTHDESRGGDSLMNNSMAAFTNSKMDTILHMPRKKRGRKPKTHIIGNSCFVWKDLTSTRSSSSAEKSQK